MRTVLVVYGLDLIYFDFKSATFRVQVCCHRNPFDFFGVPCVVLGESMPNPAGVVFGQPCSLLMSAIDLRLPIYIARDTIAKDINRSWA